MLIPKRTKYRKPHRVSYDGHAKGNTELHLGDYGLMAKEGAWISARQIEARAPFRSVQKRAIRNAMKAGAKGIKTLVSGRVGGAEMARGEGYTEGTVPLHTVRADIDYGTAEALTTYGIIGVKLWIYKGEILPANKNKKGETLNVNSKKN